MCNVYDTLGDPADGDKVSQVSDLSGNIVFSISGDINNATGSRAVDCTTSPVNGDEQVCLQKAAATALVHTLPMRICHTQCWVSLMFAGFAPVLRWRGSE
jgi:hypothetical protein